MKTIKKDIILACDAKKVWEMITEKSKYELWTKAFSPSSTFTGNMALGAEIKFEDGTGNGLIAKITTFSPNEAIAFTFIGEIIDGKRIESSQFLETIESYQLEEQEKGTRFSIQSMMPEMYYDEMSAMWDAALQDLAKYIETAKN